MEINIEKKINVFYRISDKGNPVGALPYATKFRCLENAIKEFGADALFVIADNCNETTIKFLEDHNLSFEETSLGNFESFKYMIRERILKEDDDLFVYLLEDDYLHRPGSKNVLLEGLEIADYATLYDHPDKYWMEKDGGNPFNLRKFQPCRVYITQSTHWKTTNSTPMTFACKVKTLREDYKVFFKYSSRKGKIPKSFYVFSELTRQRKLNPMFFFWADGHKNLPYIVLWNFFRRKKRVLINSIPGYASHCHEGLQSPFINWESVANSHFE